MTEDGFSSARRPDDLPARDEVELSGADHARAFFRELPVLLGIALVLAFLLRTFVMQVFYVPSGSMDPTLQINDRMIVEKVSYLFGDPNRGDIIVFAGDEPANGNDSGFIARGFRTVGQFLGVVPTNARDFVKRVIGLPGDEVFVDEDGLVYVNGVPVAEDYIVHEDRRPYPRDGGTITVPGGQLFVMGDNRPASSDSRGSLGFIAIDHVVGRAMIIIWPFSNFGGMPTTDWSAIPDATAS